MTERVGDFIQTYTGRQFWPLDPRPEDICIEDIAHALSNICRFNGHVKQFYSVAEHCVFVALSLPVQHRMAGLLHDASEAYLCDLPRPIKRNVVGYEAAEHKVMQAIALKFGLAEDLPPIVKELDTRILLDERELFMAPSDHDWGMDDIEPLGVQLRGWTPREAEMAFMSTYITLGEKVNRA